MRKIIGISIVSLLVVAVGVLGWVAVDSRSRLSKAEKRLQVLEQDLSTKADSSDVDEVKKSIDELTSCTNDAIHEIDGAEPPFTLKDC